MRTLTICCSAASSSPPPPKLAAAALKSLDAHTRTLETAEQRCAAGLACLRDLDPQGLTWALGPNVVNRVMRLCADDACCAESLYGRLHDCGLHDAASLEILASSRLSCGALGAAAEAIFHEHYPPVSSLNDHSQVAPVPAQ